MTLEKLKFLITASKKETEKQWGNRDGLQYTNELLEQLEIKVKAGEFIFVEHPLVEETLHDAPVETTLDLGLMQYKPVDKPKKKIKKDY